MGIPTAIRYSRGIPRYNPRVLRALLGFFVLTSAFAGSETYTHADANGIRFKYSARIAQEAVPLLAAKRTLRSATDHPGGVVPEHAYFRLKGPYDAFYESLRNAGIFSLPPEIHVYPLAGFKEVLAIEPRYVARLDQNVARFEKLIRKKRKPTYLQDALFAAYPIMDVSATFLARPHFLRFKSGKGFAFLTQLNVETAPFNPDKLIYVFQGLTKDGTRLVSATFPVHPISEFPREEPQAFFEKYATDRKGYGQYLAQTKKKLESLRQSQFDPPLDALDDWVESIEIDPHATVDGADAAEKSPKPPLKNQP